MKYKERGAKSERSGMLKLGLDCVDPSTGHINET